MIKIIQRLRALVNELDQLSSWHDRLIRTREVDVVSVGFKKKGAGRASVTVELYDEMAQEVRRLTLDTLNKRMQELQDEVEKLAKEL